MNRIGIKIDLDTGDLVSSAGRARQSIAGLADEMKKAQKEGRWEDYTKISFERDRLQGKTSGFERDIKTLANDPRFQTQTSTGGTVLKIDSEYANAIKNQTDAIKKLTAEYEEAIRSGDTERIRGLTPQIEKQQSDFHKTVQEASAPPGSKTARDASFSSFLNVQTAQQIVGAVTSGINTYVAHLDRSSIVNAMGSGDVMGAQIDELHRGAAEKSAFWGSVGRIGGGILGGIIGSFVAPGPGTAAGVAIGSTLLGAGGDLVGTLGDEKKANEMATSEAYAKLWERQAPDAMELTALLGKYGGTDAENTKAIRRTFENAANTATGYGYSPEEGMEQVKQAAYQGLNEGQALKAARDVFAFERGTGADRGVLAEYRTRTERFGGESNGLNTAYQGLQASGMAPAQFNEFLRAMQRTFEDGISKGFVRGSKEISETLTFLSDLNNGSELWKGEQGANRLSQMNAGIEKAKNLESTTDILIYRGAQNVLEGYTDKDWTELLDVDNDGIEDIIKGRGSSEYLNPMLLIERGLTSKLFNESMKMFSIAEKGDYAGIIARMNNGFELKYAQSAPLYRNWIQHRDTPGYFDSKEFARELEKYSEKPPENDSTELTMLSYVNDIKKYTQDIGQWHLDQKMPEIIAALKEEWGKARKHGNTSDPLPGKHPGNPTKDDLDDLDDLSDTPKEDPEQPPDWKSIDTGGMPPTEAMKIWQREYIESLESGDRDRVDNASRNLEIAQMQAMSVQPFVDPIDEETRNPGMEGRQSQDIIRQTKDATKHLFSEFLGDNGKLLNILGNNESKQMTTINKTIEAAAKSGDLTQFNAAREAADTLSRYGKDEKTGKPYNEANTFNPLAEFSGDMIGMLDALRGLIERIDNVQVNVERQ
jgi:hypothetical protein